MRDAVLGMAETTGDAFRRVRVGVALAGDLEEGGRAPLEPFCEALAGALDLVVTGHRYPHYQELLDGMHAGEIDLAWLPPVVALRATARGRTLPIALPVRGGSSSFHGALFARKDHPASRAKDLKGARVAWVDRQSAAGYLVIRAGLKSEGVDLTRAFAHEAFLGSHDAVVHAVLTGAVDVGATFAYLDAARSVRRAAWGTATVKVLALAGPIPADVVAATIRMPVALIRKVQRALASDDAALRRASLDLFAAESFVEARPEHLEPLEKLLAHLAEDPRATSIPPPR
jgi:phosphate/phosphite/phosphonate ABC transporter binding protein